MDLQQQANNEAEPSLLDHQLSILRNKLHQRATIIRHLTHQVHLQRMTTISIIQQFSQHEHNIISRLRKLQEINIKYIKDYLLLKKQFEVEGFSKSESHLTDRPDEYFRSKYYSVRKDLQDKVDKNQEQVNYNPKDSFVKHCTNLIKNFLLERQPQYEQIINQLSQQRKAKLASVKGLDEFRKNKEEDKYIESIKEKTKKFATSLKEIGENNVVQTFNIRKDIEMRIGKLSPDLAEVSLEDSVRQQKMLQKIIEEVVMLNVEPGSVEEQLGQQYLNQEFTSFQTALKQQTNKYPNELFTNSINNMDNLSKEAKEAIMHKKSYRELVLTNKPQSVEFKNIQDVAEDRERQTYARKKQTKRLMEQEEEQYEVLQAEREQQEEEQDISEQLKQNEEEGESIQQLRQKRQSKETTTKVNTAFQTVMTKSYFQQQQKARDELISQQTSQIQQHQKVIDKLITFIKKEFKDKKMEDIQGDDPEQLMSYYFRVNEKKYVDIKTEMKELQTEKKSIEREVSNLKEENIELQKQRDDIKMENQALRMKEDQLEQENKSIKTQIYQITEERTKIQQEKQQMEEILYIEKQKYIEIETENQNLKIKLQLQKLQILALSQIYQGVKSNTKEFHTISNRTQNIVKLSLQVLFSTCLNKLTPQELITRLEKIIELIKVNMKVKRDLTFELGIEGYLDHEENRVKKNFSLKVNEQLVPLAINDNKLKRKSSLKTEQHDLKARLRQERKEKFSDSKSFSDELQELAYDIIEKTFRNQDSQKQQVQEVDIPLKSETHEQQKQGSMFANMGLPEDLTAMLMAMVNTIKGKDQKTEGQENEENMMEGQKQRSQDEKNEKGFDQNFIEKALQKIRQMKESKYNEDEDLKQMYEKYKQALSCLQRAQNLNKESQMKYQQFLTDLKSKGAKGSPQALEDKLFYMQRVIATQNQLLQSQRKQFEQTIVKQVQKSQKLAEDVFKGIRLRRSQN